jgi:hypothetical protein
LVRLRVSIGERQGNGNVFATIWRSKPTMSVSGRTYLTDESERSRPHRYERRFNPGEVTAEAVVP